MAKPDFFSNMAGSFIDELVNSGMNSVDKNLDIIEFADNILGLTLWVPQKAMLKVLYNLPLEPDEEAWLLKMKAENKTTWVPGRVYQELDLEAGMRTSKSFTASVIVAYEFFSLIRLPDPAAHYGLAPGSPIFITTTATTQQQSKDTIFGNTKARLMFSPYFKTLIDRKEIIINDDRIECHSKLITVIGGHSNQAALVGKTAKLFCMDEAARFRDPDSGVNNARSMYANVGRSTTTLKEHGKKVIISSAWEDGDIMEWLYDLADPALPNQKAVAFRLATWDMNPNITKADVEDEYRRDETAAKRDFEGIRPGLVENFFVKQHLLTSCTGNQIIEPRKTIRIDDGVDGSKRHYVSLAFTDAIPKIGFGKYSYGHCDPGLVGDSFTFVSGHPERMHGGLGCVIDLICVWEPEDRGKGIVWPVSYENVEDVVKQVHGSRNLRRLTFDHWQSAAHIQRLYSRGIVTHEINFNGGTQLALYQVARQKFGAGLVVLPSVVGSDGKEDRIRTKALKELINIQLLRGTKIDHPKKNPDETKGSKDIADAIVSVIAQCADDERQMLFSGQPGQAKKMIQPVGQTKVAGLMPYSIGRGSIRNVRQEI